MKTEYRRTLDEPLMQRIEDFVRNHPEGNYFQSTVLYRLTEKIPQMDPAFIFVTDPNKKIMGILLVLRMCNGKGLKSWFTRRVISWGGPLIDQGCENPAYIADNILAGLIKNYRDRAIYIEFRNQFAMNRYDPVLIKNGFRFSEHLNYLVYLDPMTTETGIHKSKRRQIRKSQENGAIIRPAENLMEVREFYGILKKLYRQKVKKPFPGLLLFEEFFRDPEQGVIMLVEKSGVILGGMMCPVYKDTIYEWYVGSDDSVAQGIYAGVLATWAPLKYGLETGLKKFDFMGAGQPEDDYGVRKFKSQFGGTEVNFGRYLRINKQVPYRIGKMKIALSSRFKV